MSILRKCIVWDLDNTLWDGVCLEGTVTIKPEVINTICELDRRGILHSIASRGDEESAVKVLRQNNLYNFFLVPKINWLPKSQNILSISKELNINCDSITFVDDDKFELEQVQFMLPDVLVIEAEKASDIIMMPEFLPGEQTTEASGRRIFYQSEIERKKVEDQFSTREDFLLSCRMKLHIRQAYADDVPRIMELMTRTHQLNTTGFIFERSFIDGILKGAACEKLYVAELTDKFGSYGIIGTAITMTEGEVWKLLYLALSCRVIGRGIERAFLFSIMNEAVSAGMKKAQAEFRDTGKNKMMRTLYQMSGFSAEENIINESIQKFSRSMVPLPTKPVWVELV